MVAWVDPANFRRSRGRRGRERYKIVYYVFTVCILLILYQSSVTIRHTVQSRRVACTLTVIIQYNYASAYTVQYVIHYILVVRINNKLCILYISIT